MALLEWGILYRLFGNFFPHDTYPAKVLQMNTFFNRKHTLTIYNVTECTLLS